MAKQFRSDQSGGAQATGKSMPSPSVGQDGSASRFRTDTDLTTDNNEGQRQLGQDLEIPESNFENFTPKC